MSKSSYRIYLLFGQFRCIMSCLKGSLSNILDFIQLHPSLEGRFFSVETDVKGYLSLTQVMGQLFLCLDYWLSDGQQFYDLLPSRMLSFMGMPWDAKVLDIIEEGTWAFPSRSQELQTIQESMHFHPRIALPNLYFQKVHSSRKFIIDLNWKVLQNSRLI